MKKGDLVVRKPGYELPDEWPNNEPRRVVGVPFNGIQVEGVIHTDTCLYTQESKYLMLVPQEEPKTEPLSSIDLLQDCMDIQQERGKQYDARDSQERSFKRVATAFNAITQRDLKGSDIALILQILKDVRLYTNLDSLHEDSVLDKVSYASLHGEEMYTEFKDKNNG